MLNNIWESIKDTFSIVYEKIVSKLKKPAFFTLSMFSLYGFIFYLIHYQIILAFFSLYAAALFFKLFEEEK